MAKPQTGEYEDNTMRGYANNEVAHNTHNLFDVPRYVVAKRHDSNLGRLRYPITNRRLGRGIDGHDEKGDTNIN